MEGTTWANGLILMLTGMFVVYMLLVILILAMKGMSALMAPLNKILPEPVIEVKKSVKKKTTTNADEEVVAAIVAAKLIGSKN